MEYAIYKFIGPTICDMGRKETEQQDTKDITIERIKLEGYGRTIEIQACASVFSLAFHHQNGLIVVDLQR